MLNVMHRHDFITQEVCRRTYFLVCEQAREHIL